MKHPEIEVLVKGYTLFLMDLESPFSAFQKTHTNMGAAVHGAAESQTWLSERREQNIQQASKCMNLTTFNAL